MAIKFTPVTLDAPQNGIIKVTGTQSVGKAKAKAVKRLQKNGLISATMSKEKPKVTLPKFSWDQ
jgi:hypothetical protein